MTQFSQIPPAVAALLREGQAALQKEREAERQAELKRQLAAQALEQQFVTAILTAACALLPEALHGYLSFPADLEPNASSTYCLLMVPGCVPVRVTVNMSYNATPGQGYFEPMQGAPNPSAKLLTLPEVENGEWSFYKSRQDRRPANIDKVLAEARELETRRRAQVAWSEAEAARQAQEAYLAEDPAKQAPVDPWTAACLKLGEAVCRLIDGRDD